MLYTRITKYTQQQRHTSNLGQAITGNARPDQSKGVHILFFSLQPELIQSTLCRQEQNSVETLKS